jgi:hypothetical protein
LERSRLGHYRALETLQALRFVICFFLDIRDFTKISVPSKSEFLNPCGLKILVYLACDQETLSNHYMTEEKTYFLSITKRSLIFGICNWWNRRVPFEPYAEADGTDQHNIDVNTDNNSDY